MNSDSADTSERQTYTALLQMRAMYEMTTQITKKCFDSCIPRINPRMEDSERACLNNCAANYLKMKMTIAQLLLSSIQVQSDATDSTDNIDMGSSDNTSSL
jgi:hypothetical protein